MKDEGHEKTPQPSDKDEAEQEPSFVICPFCLGTGVRFLDDEDGLPRRQTRCPQCSGLGSLDDAPLAEEL